MGQNNITGPIPPGWQLPNSERPRQRTAARRCQPAAVHACGGGGLTRACHRMRAGLDTLFFNDNPLGGPLPGAWALPDRLSALLLENTQLTGTLPPEWRMPAQMRSLNLAKNRLAGTIPPAFWGGPNAQVGRAGACLHTIVWRMPGACRRMPTERAPTALALLQRARPSYRLPSPAPAQVFGFSFNQLMGPVPASVAFNASFEVLGLGISGNNLSGGCPLPSRRPGACHQLPAVSRGRRVRRLWVGSRRAVIMQAPAHAGCPPGCHPHRPFACVASLSPVRH